MKNIYFETISKSYHHVCDWVFKNLPADASASVSLDAECTTYIRFNNHRVRQNSKVEQAVAKVLLLWKKKSYRFSYTLSGNTEDDLKKIKLTMLKAFSDWDKFLNEDIHIPLAQNQESRNYLLSPFDEEKILRSILNVSSKNDFTGITSMGPILSIVRNSFGVHHEFLSEFITVDYSLFDGPKAVKGVFSTPIWNEHEFASHLAHSLSQLESMKKNRVDLKPDYYRVYLAPGAISEITQVLNWGAVSQRSYKQGRNPFKRLIERDLQLSRELSLTEDFNLGLGPQFNSLGEKAPTLLPIIEKGELKNLLTSTKTAVEFGGESNQASDEEHFRSLSIDTGTLKADQILSTLDTGLFISNLHYLNWSNPMDARITGMTRYACFWVKKGQIQGPIADLRFDDSLFNIWGKELESITQFSELEPNTSTYYQRQLGGKRLPGMLVKSLKFTL